VRRGGILSGHDYSPSLFPGVVKAVEESFGNEFFVGPDDTWIHFR